jgi:hypothetical protein
LRGIGTNQVAEVVALKQTQDIEIGQGLLRDKQVCLGHKTFPEGLRGESDRLRGKNDLSADEVLDS